MDNVTRLLMQSSGGKKDSTYLDDVFSTYLYKGNNPNTQVIENGLKLGNANVGNSVLFDDTDDYLQIAHTTDLCFGNGDFTIECWAYYRGDFDSFDALFGNWTGSGDNGYVLETVGSGATTDLEFYWYKADGNYILVQGGTVSKNQWNHLCVCRSGNTIRVFVNGTMHGSGTSMTEGIRDGTSNFTIGGQVAGGGWWNGYITNLRVTKGQGLYTSNFTPSTAALTTTSQGATASNVKLLCCNKGTVTGKTVGPTITATGNPTVSEFGAFTATDGEGGLVWIKSRTNTYNHILQDTENGTGKFLISNATNAATNTNQYITSFNNNGFTVGTDNDINNSSQNFASWSFRKAKGFCDIVKFTGSGGTNASPQTINHSLKSIPGMIIIKNLTQAGQWFVYHRSIGVDKFLQLNKVDPAINYNGGFKNITSSSIDVFDSNSTNTNEFIAYVFAGGESDAATARSVAFSSTGSNDGAKSLTIAGSSGTNFGSGDFTMECWFKDNAGISEHDTIFATSDYNNNSSTNSFNCYVYEQGIKIFDRTGGSFDTKTTVANTYDSGTWVHFAWTRSGSGSNNNTIWLNGMNVAQFTGTLSYTDGQDFYIGGNDYSNTGTPNEYGFNGNISNVRITKGQAIYTSSFKPSYEPLTTTTGGATASNVKVICCNNSSITGSSLTSGTITSTNTPTASTDSPFDDLQGFKFGEDGKQQIIKMDSHNHTTTNPVRIYTGWEPQWLMIKNTAQSSNWAMFDVMRGMPVGGDDQTLAADSNAAENGVVGQPNAVEAHADGFTLNYGLTAVNTGNGQKIIYMAIRRPDSLVVKPAETGTDAFAMDVGNGNTTQAFDSGFPVDWAITRAPASATNWETGGRLIQGKWVATNTTDAQSPAAYFSFDSNTGWMKNASAYNTTYQSWMWKRDAGFDVVAYEGTNTAGLQIRHSLNAVPEMIWTKNRDATENWCVYHKGLNGGTNPQDYALRLNTPDPEIDADGWWNDTAPTATLFTIGNSGNTNGFEKSMIAMLFASVEGISKVGSYSGSSYDVTINLGFTPRFLIVKACNPASSSQRWQVMDTLRGMAAGATATNRMYLDINSPQQAGPYVTSVSSTGITLKTGYTYSNSNGNQYIYYAHA